MNGESPGKGYTMRFRRAVQSLIVLAIEASAILACGSFANAQSYITKRPAGCPWKLTSDGGCPSARENMDAAACVGATEGIAVAKRTGDPGQIAEARTKARQLGCLGKR